MRHTTIALCVRAGIHGYDAFAIAAIGLAHFTFGGQMFKPI